jgi:hypothetical protein
VIDAVLDFHMSPHGCGVSKFNFALAQRLGVPVLSFNRHPRVTPLVSVKTSELAGPTHVDHVNLCDVFEDIAWFGVYDLFFHDQPCPSWRDVIAHARRVYVANGTIAARADQVIGFCPPTLGGNATRGAYRVLTFGMIHKQLAHHFTQLKHRLDAEHPDYTIEFSAVQHEGQTATVEQGAEALRAIFGDKLRVLGQLADDALARELAEVDAVALYYQPALRANNTSAWAALEAGKQLYTNTDAYSPPLDASLHSWERLTALIQGAE